MEVILYRPHISVVFRLRGVILHAFCQTSKQDQTFNTHALSSGSSSCFRLPSHHCLHHVAHLPPALSSPLVLTCYCTDSIVAMRSVRSRRSYAWPVVSRQEEEEFEEISICERCKEAMFGRTGRQGLGCSGAARCLLEGDTVYAEVSDENDEGQRKNGSHRVQVHCGWSNGGEFVLPENGRTGAKAHPIRMVLDPLGDVFFLFCNERAPCHQLSDEVFTRKDPARDPKGLMSTLLMLSILAY